MEEPAEELDRNASELISAAIEVHQVLGPGFLESVYEHALCIELGLRDLPYRRQVPISVGYKGHSAARAASTFWWPISWWLSSRLSRRWHRFTGYRFALI